MRFKIQQRSDEQHHEQFRVQLYPLKERQLAGKGAQGDLYERRGYLGYEATEERRCHDDGDNAENKFDYGHKFPYLGGTVSTL